MNVRMIFLAATFCVTACGAANACDLEASNAAYKAGDYVKAQALAAKGKSDICLQAQADAAFAQGKQQEAHSLYAKSWAVALDDAYDETKGSSKFWSGVGTAVGILAMAGGLYAAREGVMTADQATDTMMKGQQIVSSVDEGFKEATGNIDYRKTVKATIKDLKVLAKKGSSSLQVINPSWSTIPGAGLARVHVNGRVCNAIRDAKASYLTSRSCLAEAGLEHEKYVSIESTLRSSDYAKVTDQYFHRGGTMSMLFIPASGDGKVVSNDWIPRIFHRGIPVRTAAVWYARELNHLVPVFQECAGVNFEGCGDIYANSATLWVSTCADAGCSWDFYGFAGANGKIERPD